MKTDISLKNRKRRIIWNNDGDDLATTANYDAEGAECRDNPGYHRYPKCFKSVDEFLRLRMKGMIDGTQVDSIFYNGYGFVPNWEFPSENTKVLGPDPLTHAVKFAHDNGMEFFYSFRMNDIHLAVHQGLLYWSKFRMENLHLLQGNIDREWFERHVLPWARGLTKKHPLTDAYEVGRNVLYPYYVGAKPNTFRSWAAYDFAHSEVREYYLQLVQEACRRYDLDGIEFDWGRTPPFFKSGSRCHAPVMTDFMRRVRQWLNDWGRKRSRAVLFATRVPDFPAEALSLSLDVETWLRDGLIDMVIAGFGARPFSYPLADWVNLGHAHEVPVYGCIENGRPFSAKPEVIRATAQRYWDAGADGVYLYNHFYEYYDPNRPKDPDWPNLDWPVPPRAEDTLHDIGDPKRLERLDKVYCVDDYGEPSQLPLLFTTQSGASTSRITLEIADDPKGASRLAVQTQWEAAVDVRRVDTVGLGWLDYELTQGEAAVDINRVSWQLNGEPLSNGRPFVPKGEEEPGWVEYETRTLKKGINTFEVTVHPTQNWKPTDGCLLKQVRVSICYS